MVETLFILVIVSTDLYIFTGAKRKSDETRRTSKKTQKTQKRAWSFEEEGAVRRHLGRYITMGTFPGKNEIEICMKNETVLNRRTWRNIKDFIRNKITANARNARC